MSKIGFIGLGIMGAPMARNLLKSGHEVIVWNRTASRMHDLVQAGARPAFSASEAASGSEFIITIVTDSAAVKEVVLSKNGIIEKAATDSVVIDMSTISPSVTKEISKQLGSRGVHMLDAPVSGGLQGAINGTLSIMVGGEKPIFDRCTPVLYGMGKRVTYCGPTGMGQVTKLANQVVGLGTLAAVCEGLLFATKAGGDPDAVLSALGGGAANSWMVENLGPRIFDRDFKPGFMVDLALKDLMLVTDSASEIKLPLVTTPLVTQVMRAAQTSGHGREGIQAYIKVLEALAKFEARKTDG